MHSKYLRRQRNSGLREYILVLLPRLKIFQKIIYLNFQCGDKWWEWELQTDLSFGLPETYKGTMGDLMNAITENREHISSGRDNLKTVKAYLAGILSQKEKRPVNPEEIE